MDKSEILKNVAPCSLMCHTCSGYHNGVICESAKALLKFLDGIKEFYEKHIPDAVESYSNFEETLRIYSSAPCSGCRSTEHNGCSIKGCFLLKATPHIWLPSKRNMKKHSAESRVDIIMFNFMFTGHTESD